MHRSNSRQSNTNPYRIVPFTYFLFTVFTSNSHLLQGTFLRSELMNNIKNLLHYSQPQHKMLRSYTVCVGSA